MSRMGDFYIELAEYLGLDPCNDSHFHLTACAWETAVRTARDLEARNGHPYSLSAVKRIARDLIEDGAVYA